MSATTYSQANQCGRHFSVSALLVCALQIWSGPALSQETSLRQFEASVPKQIRVNDERSAPLSPSERANLEDRIAKIRLHMLPVPMGESRLPFSKRMLPATSLRSSHPDVKLNLVTTVNEPAGSYATSEVSEPTVATMGNQAIVTGNWFAAWSDNFGQNFSRVDPVKAYGTDQLGQTICCDQVVYKVTKRDTVVWLMQGMSAMHNTPPQGNAFKLLVARNQADLQQRLFQSYEFPSSIFDDLGDGPLWLDYPDISSTNEYLFVTFNLFTVDPRGPRWARAAVFRMPLQALATGEKFKYAVWTTDRIGALKLTQGAHGAMVFASSNFTPVQLALWVWRDGSNAPSSLIEVPVERWNSPREWSGRTVCQDNGAANWLGRQDGRMSAAWEFDGRVAFAWTSAPEPRFPCYHVRIAIVPLQPLLNNSSGIQSPESQPHLWSPDTSYAYLAAAPNKLDVTGVSVAFANQSTPPSHAVGILDPFGRTSATGWEWKLVATKQSTGWSQRPVWGDYLTVRPDDERPNAWTTAGQFLRQMDTRPVQPHVALVRFESPQRVPAYR